ncbi:MAG: hypothetical protein Q9M36_03040 [Sulfurovum sp.]|nr:hypothetical protein [Sulfurovum sp.]
MKKIIMVITVLLISVLNANQISFKGLVALASSDLRKTIYVDKDIKDYSIDFNIQGTPKSNESYAVLSKVLKEHNLTLEYNFKMGFYTIEREIVRAIRPPSSIASDVDKLHYYTYKIKNVINKDVEKVFEIVDINYTFLNQSDTIAYSCTKERQIEINNLLSTVDTEVKQATIKISIFSVNKDNLRHFGTDLDDFAIGVNLNLSQNLLEDSISSLEIPFLTSKMYFHALHRLGVTKISHEPTILLSNGIESIIQSVSNVRYVVGTSSVEDARTEIVEEYEYRDVGLKIKILPKIQDDFISLDLDLTSEEFINYQIDNPTVGKIYYKNSFKVTRDKPLLLTGINKAKIIDTDSSVPLLSAIPLIGELFKSEEKSVEEQNINILIEVM